MLWLHASGWTAGSAAIAEFTCPTPQLGGIGAMARERRHDLAKLGLKAMLVGSFATFSAACVAILT